MFALEIHKPNMLADNLEIYPVSVMWNWCDPKFEFKNKFRIRMKSERFFSAKKKIRKINRLQSLM